MEPFFDKLARHKKEMGWFGLSVLTAVLWDFLSGFVGLSEDDMRPHALLDAVLSIMTFPASVLPGLDSYDSETATMPMQTWQWYSETGFMLNSLLWGSFLVWIFRLVVGQFAFRHKVPQTIIIPPQRPFPGWLRHPQILYCVVVFSLLLVLWAGCGLFFYARNHDVIGIDDAVRSGDLEKVRMLLKEQPDLIFSKDSNGTMPLHWSLEANGADYDYKDMVELLLANGADVNARNKQDWTPLELAAENGLKDVAQLLLAQGAEVDAKDDNGVTPLDNAAANGRVDVVKLLLAQGADVNASNDFNGTPLDNAASGGQQDVARLLLAQGARVNVHDAAALGDLRKLKALLKDNPDLVFSKDSEERTPLHWAAITGQTNTVALLLVSKAEVNARDDEGNTPLHFAAFYDYADVAELLLANKADVNARNNEGMTPLHRAVMWGHIDIVKVLLANKADINAKDQYGYTPLHYAVNNEDKHVVELLRRDGGSE